MTPDSEVSAAFAAAFRARAAGTDALDYAAFIELALYEPHVGYYRQVRSRIGYGAGTDFYTATTGGTVFGELIVAACESLLGASVREHTFVELGAELAGGVLAGVTHPFAAARTIRVGEPLDLLGPCIVFSNELFDAQPFRRHVWRTGTWRELGVRLSGSAFAEVELDRPVPPYLPAEAPEGYVIDAPVAAAELAGAIAAQSWSGLFLAFDYGKSWHELITACPAGTARAYSRHRQSNDLLARPGEQDLTCHVCWDWIESALARHGFSRPALEAQEAFLIRRAIRAIAAIADADAGRFSHRKQSLQKLLQPGQMGRKFQVLHALRSAFSEPPSGGGERPAQVGRAPQDCP